MRFRIKLYEWDMNNGEYVYRDYQGEEVEVKDKEELWKIIEKSLGEIAKDAEEDGWDCEITANGNMICTKDREEREVGFDIEEVS